MFNHYTKPFDIMKPPPPPPLRMVKEGFFCAGETKASKEKTREWQLRLKEYGDNLDQS